MDLFLISYLVLWFTVGVLTVVLLALTREVALLRLQLGPEPGALATKDGFVVDDYRDDAVGVMARNDQGRLAMTLVTLRPAVRFSGAREPDAAALNALHHRAHEACYIANSVRTDIRCEPVIPH